MEIRLSAIQGLPADGNDGAARAAALQALESAPVGTAGFVEYRSAGLLLIVGPETPALAAARALAERLDCAVVATPGDGEPAADAGRFVIARGRPSLSGYLGAYRAELRHGAETVNLAPLARRDREGFDLVLDLGETALIGAERPPIGYFHAADEDAVGAALEALPELVGEFQKPKFFVYDENLCAHGARGQIACTRCLDACAADAIRPAGERIEVDPYLCQGCGSCATVCPSGAMGYGYPTARDLLGIARRTLRAYQAAGGTAPAVLLHDDGDGAEALLAAGAALPERLLPLPVEDSGSVGLDTWFGLLALGATDVLLLMPEAAEPSLRRATEVQIDYAHRILDGLGLGVGRVRLLTSGEALRDAAAGLSEPLPMGAGQFSTSGGKRPVFQGALAHLTGGRGGTVALPEGAPFGRIEVDRDACTLCMACAAVCPVEAVTSAGAEPRLLFHEDRCVQCGLCEQACPEDAIALRPELSVAAHTAPAERVLNEDAPFHCVECGKAFATASMVERIAGKLTGHWMFQDENARRRLRMCEDCRVRDLLAEEGGVEVRR